MIDAPLFCGPDLARRIEAAEASPDGSLVAVVLRIRDGLEGEGHAELHLLAVDGGRSIAL